MAISTYGVTLMKGTAAGESITYSKLVDIKDFPDLGAAPQTIETTTLSDSAQTFINGVKTTAAMEFTANYTPEEFATISALEGVQKFALYFGQDGANGKFIWDGEASVWIVGGGVNAVVDMKISILPAGEITKQAQA